MRRTKIVATLGPVSSDAATIRALMEAGLDVARLNFSHGTHDDHARVFQTVRQVARDLGRPVAVLADLQGPKIRVGPIAGGSVPIEAGAELTITTQNVTGSAREVSTTYAALPGDVRPNDRILLDDGALELSVLRVEGERVHCRVVLGGVLGEHKGINLPGVAVSAPALTDKDRDDLAFALDLGVDYVALSFVRRASDVHEIRDAMADHGRSAPVVTKIEKPEALDDLDAILEATDAVMVARGDLGVEAPLERVPLLQKEIIERAHRFSVPAITATQMLQSMMGAPRPTRAEASDVANAIFDGTDAVMLSGETAAGAYPIEAVRVMDRIVRAAEASALERRPYVDAIHVSHSPIANTIASCVCEAAHNIGARGIVVFSRSGATARLVSLYRSARPVVGVTPSPDTWRRMALYWGVQPFLCPELHSGAEIVRATDRAARLLPGCRPGDVIAVTSGASVVDESVTNSLRLQIVGTEDAGNGA